MAGHLHSLAERFNRLRAGIDRRPHVERSVLLPAAVDD